MNIHLVPALKDNYMYLLVDKESGNAAAVDPVEPEKLLQKVEELQVNLTTVLTTHHHWDHAGGNVELAKLRPGLIVVGGDERVGALTKQVKHGDEITLGSLKVKSLFTPCHTSGHICYFVDEKDPAVFTGDTLFVAGCGRFFEGNAEQMYKALIGILSELPDHTKVYCGHEYTLQNFKFATHVEPSNPAADEMKKRCENLRNEGKPTVPSTIGEEKKYNPFMRVKESSILQYTKTSDPVEAMKILRSEKDSF
ncbi:hydroxyacylglutathione hydrolase, mitochondrial-like isoform X2 [Artemia franciscana]|nr:hypothetical protein QYM36_017664 [Artemia franciscana]